jgi:hypothetical protein
MRISDLRQEIETPIRSFVWDQWGQMGVFTASGRRDPWAADPEALLLLTFEVGREEPRLFEEVLDWLVVNERQISVQRLRNLVEDDRDRALVEAVLGWVAQWRRRARLTAKPSAPSDSAPAPFFRGDRQPVRDPDPAFLAQGFLKSKAEPARRAQPPSPLLPINFAFRMRFLFGVGARAEVARVLLTSPAPQVELQALVGSSGYTKRNVQEALNSLRSAGVVLSSTIGSARLFEAPRQRWSELLGPREFPSLEDWPQLFWAQRRILRWLADPAKEKLSPYLRASEARVLLETVAPDLNYFGVDIDPSGPDGDDYWEYFVDSLRALSKTIDAREIR